MKQILCHPESDCLFTGDPDRRGDEVWQLYIVNLADIPAGTEIQTDLGVSVVLPSMDFETYSEAGYVLDPTTGNCRGAASDGKGGLPVVGTPVYAEHPSTEVLCLYYDLKDGRGQRAWYPGFPDPIDLLEYVARGLIIDGGTGRVSEGPGLIEAWNVTFEFWIWNMVCVRRYGWPPLAIEQCRCAMAKSRRHSLPGSLDKAAKVLGTTPKHKEGHALIRKLCVPSKFTKKREAFRWTPATNWTDFTALYAYCGGDVTAEDEASAHIPDLTPYELQTWQLDQRINARGVQVDVAALDAALDLLEQTERKYNGELAQITGGCVPAATQLPALKRWLLDTQGVDLPNMQAETIREAIAPGNTLPPAALRTLEIRDCLGSANVKKLRKLKLQVSSDGRLRNQYMYCGADRTGRASSAAADDNASNSQLQNITAKGPKTCMCESCEEIFGQHGYGTPECPRCDSWLWHELPEWTVEAVGFAVKDLLTRDLALIERIWGDPIALLCGCLRGLFVAKEGHELVCCDFSAIEAVVAACISRCQWRIDVFSDHGKIYEESAAKATGIPFEEIMEYKRINKQDHPARKTIGKVRELAGGYGGWIGAWKNFGADEFMADDEAIKTDVLKWRDESPEIVEMWGGQFRWCGPGKWDYRPELFGLEGAVINAIRNPGKCFSHIDITYGVWDDILFCRLPSGRFLKYHKPRLAPAEDKLRRGPAVQITFEGYNSNSQKGPIGWILMETYGGRLFENCIAEGTLVLTGRGWRAIETVQDDDLVHDGVGWATHGGCIFKSRQACVVIDGVHMTPEHEVLTDDGWKTALQSPTPYRPDLWYAYGTAPQRHQEKMVLSMRVWRYLRKTFEFCFTGAQERARTQLRVPSARPCGPALHDAEGRDDDSTSFSGKRAQQSNAPLPGSEQLASGTPIRRARLAEPRKVYDILNAGPRQRFVVLGDTGPFIVHNCVQAVAADLQFDALHRCEQAGYGIVMHTHDEGAAEVPTGWGSVEEMVNIMTERPEWASWWPLRAAGWRHKRYQK